MSGVLECGTVDVEDPSTSSATNTSVLQYVHLAVQVQAMSCRFSCMKILVVNYGANEYVILFSDQKSMYIFRLG